MGTAELNFQQLDPAQLRALFKTCQAELKSRGLGVPETQGPTSKPRAVVQRWKLKRPLALVSDYPYCLVPNCNRKRHTLDGSSKDDSSTAKPYKMKTCRKHCHKKFSEGFDMCCQGSPQQRFFLQEMLANQEWLQSRSFNGAPKALPESLTATTKSANQTRLISSGFVRLDADLHNDSWIPRGLADVECVDNFDQAVCRALDGLGAKCPIPVLTFMQYPHPGYCHVHAPLARMLYSKQAAAVMAADAGRQLPTELCGYIARLACRPQKIKHV